MNRFENGKALADYRSRKKPAPDEIRVGLDTGGIAAGAGEVFSILKEEVAKAGLELPVKRTGSKGIVFADPVVVVTSRDGPEITYGAVDETVARRIITGHLVGGCLIDDHLIATRQRGLTLDGGPTTAILIKDTSMEDGDRTKFFQASFEQEMHLSNLSSGVPIHRALDMGIYDRGLCVQLLPSGVTYANVLSPDIRRIISESLLAGRVVDELLVRDPDPQVRIVLRRCGELDPESLDDSLAHGAYAALETVLGGKSPEDVIKIMEESGLRGRGGAGFPTWRKWQLTREVEAERRFVICNGDEGDPGAFMDRSVLEGDPHGVLEGLILAGYCVGASKGYFYIRAEYPLAVARVRRAIEEARSAGLLGENILGSGFSFEADVRLGAGAFVCGEETALIASIEGLRGSPVPRPPYPSVQGLWGMPTAINNVETLAAVGAIVEHGGPWYAAYGTGKSRGTKVFAVTGKVKHSQLVEIPMGVTLRTIIYDICGGLLDDEDIKAVQTGGPSGGVIPEKLLDTEVSYESLSELGSIMGSGGMLVMDKYDSMVDVARFYLKFCVDESCGKCAPCRVGGFQMLQLLETIFRGRGKLEDLDALRRICRAMQTASLCGLGQTAPNPVLSTLRYFEDEYLAFIEGGSAYAREMKKKLAEVGRKAG
ncbi:MAG: NADH-ubiquinone oxidoreductase-F iron-sulfur binding region domain-containing protein [Opitutaceae bacterium]